MESLEIWLDSRFGFGQIVEPENNIDPDDGISTLCRACRLPIFSTPFKKSDDFFLHDECADLPKELSNHVLHRGKTLVLTENQNSSSSDSDSDSCCYMCKRKCGSMMYKCTDDSWPEYPCKFQLDLLCALQITIVHRSHQHRLTAITGSAAFRCGACGTQHRGRFSALSYLCKACNYWIHPDCASLPNAITFHQHRHHSLFLIFNLSTPSLHVAVSNSKCAVCKRSFGSGGIYFCAKCNYYAHVYCAVLNPNHSFNPVLLREANLAGLLHFPMANEHTSVMPYIMKSEEASSSEVDHQHLHPHPHPHPLIFNHEDDSSDDQPARSRVCNACVRLILPEDPFYICLECPDFFLHNCCTNFPTQIKHPCSEDTLFLNPKSHNSSISSCISCNKQTNGFAYKSETNDHAIDVVCAMMPPLITHQLHAKSHILYLCHSSFTTGCDCCKSLNSRTFYKCISCSNFTLHVDCARLPCSIKHKFDDHVLTLTAGDHLPKVKQICEICEKYIKLKHWCYSCNQCDQWFHTDCIQGFSNLKLGATIKVNPHDCPLALILKSSVYGYHCDSCLQVFRPKFTSHKYCRQEQQSAYECSKCYYRMHESCAKKCS